MSQAASAPWPEIRHWQKALRLYWIVREIDDPAERAKFDGFLVRMPSGVVKPLTALSWDEVQLIWRGLFRAAQAVFDRRLLEEEYEREFIDGGSGASGKDSR